jgi:hypothetical protein
MWTELFASPITPAAAARSAGVSRYIGRPCKYGHEGLRRTHNGECVACMKLYLQRPETKKRNAERIVKYYWHNPEKFRARSRRYAAAHPKPKKGKSLGAIARAAAIASGQKTYFSNIPCSKGHLTPRYVSNNDCIQCLRESTRKYRNREKYGQEEKPPIATILCKWCKNEFLPKWRHPKRKFCSQWCGVQAHSESIARSREQKRKGHRKRRCRWCGKQFILPRRGYSLRRQHCSEKCSDSWANSHYYLVGPSTPKGEFQWLRRNQHLLRNVRRLLLKPAAASQSLKKASHMGINLLNSCPPS